MAATATAAIALGITGTISAFTSSITNTENHVTTGSNFTFSESLPGAPPGPQNPCATVVGSGATAVCTTVNKYGQVGAAATPMAPGNTRTTTVRISNNSFSTGFSGGLTLTAAACVQNPAIGVTLPTIGLAAGDLCGTMTVQVVCVLTPTPTPPAPGSVTIGPETLTGLTSGGTQPILTIPPAGFVDCTFTTTLPATAATNLQNISATQNLVWTITQAST